MAFNWRKFPWTNLHDLNLDWIIQTVKTLEENLADAVSTFKKMIDEAISSTLTGSGDLTISKTGDVKITGNRVIMTGNGGHTQMIGGAFISDTSEQLTLHNPNSKTNMTANYNSGVLTLSNTQDSAAGVAVYPINTPADGGGDNSDFAANVGYVKDKFNAINTNLEGLLTGDGDLTISKNGDVSISGNSIELSNTTISSQGEQLTLHNSASNTSMTATYNAGMLRLQNNQSTTGGVSMYPIVTLPDNTGDNSKYAANVEYVKDAVATVTGKLDTEISNRTSGDAALQSTINNVIIPRLDSISAASNSYVLLVNGTESTESNIALTSEQVTALQNAAQNNYPITMILRDGDTYTAYYPVVVGNTSMMFSRVCNFNSFNGIADVNQALGRILVASVYITDGAGAVSFLEFPSCLTPFLPLSLSITWLENANSYTLTDKEYAILRQSLLDKRPVFIVRNTADTGGEQTVYMLQTCATPSILNVDSMTLILQGPSNSIKVQMASKTIVPNIQ